MKIEKVTSTLQEMEIKKKSGTYNVYSLTVSWGQLEAIRDALALNHADPLADELFEELSWWLAGQVPLPGEDKSEKEKSDEQEEERADAEDNAEAALDLPDVPDEAFDDEPGDEAPEPKPDAKPQPDGANESADDLLDAPPLDEGKQSDWFKNKFGGGKLPKEKRAGFQLFGQALPKTKKGSGEVAQAPGKVGSK